MSSVHDIAAYILERCGSMSAMKLQKLVFYSQAASLVRYDKPLFSEEIQAWANGPVVYELFDKHRGQFAVHHWPHGSSQELGPDDRSLIDSVLECYKGISAQQLSDQTHSELPWRNARRGLPEDQPGTVIITLDSMRDYYSEAWKENGPRSARH